VPRGRLGPGPPSEPVRGGAGVERERAGRATPPGRTDSGCKAGSMCVCVRVCVCVCVLRRGIRLQIFAFIGILESFSYEKIYYGDSTPGDLGFDPLGVSDDASRAKHYAVRPAPPVTVSRLVDSAEAVLTGAASLQRAEVMNGRLAMIGFSGMLHHAILTKMVSPRPCAQSPCGQKRQPAGRDPGEAGFCFGWVPFCSSCCRLLAVRRCRAADGSRGRVAQGPFEQIMTKTFYPVGAGFK
jgi:hypothetical protein